VSDTLGLLRAVDGLYESVVGSPEQWGPHAFADWADDAATGGLTKQQARAIRRCLRMAEKLRDFWSQEHSVVSAPDWRTRVDVAFGSRAWRPTLELAQAGLEETPSPELFEEVKERFRIVNSEHWMDGIGFDEWSTKVE
jgi:hypothetical protein